MLNDIELQSVYNRITVTASCGMSLKTGYMYIKISKMQNQIMYCKNTIRVILISDQTSDDATAVTQTYIINSNEIESVRKK